MGRPAKILVWLIAALIAVFALAAVFFLLFFDANDFREDIAEVVAERTGRELRIDGDVSLAFFPWLAVEVGHTTLGNGSGFGDKPFAEFDRAKLSVRLLPMLLRRELAVGTAEVEALLLNLQVDAAGRSNWDDLLADQAPAEVEAAGEKGAAFEISGLDVSDTTIAYEDQRSGDAYVLSNVNMQLGGVSDDGRPVPANGEFLFDVQPAGISGNIDLDTVVSFDLRKGLVVFDGLTVAGVIEGIATSPTRLEFETDGITVETEAQRVTAEPLALTLLGIDLQADVEPFSYAGSVQPSAAIQVDAFSPRSVMHLLDIDAPDTADPVALSRVIIDANAAVKSNAVELTDVTIALDDTTFKGSLSVPRSSSGRYGFDLDADRINLNRYMAPADESSPESTDDAPAESAPIEIPADLINALHARGNLRVTTATLGAMEFANVVLGLNSENGRLRIHPVAADLFGGKYNGDVQVDVAGAAPVVSVDEKIEGVDLADLARAMFKRENVTGTISGGFDLSGRGDDMAAIQRSLGGNMTFELLDGTYEGTDIWYELRRARALLKGGEAPEPQLPARTRFSSVTATGVVQDGIMRNDDLFAELPFMQVRGGGTVNLPEATVNYDLTARVLERPESLQDVTEEELDDFTEAVIPLKITGPLASPSVKPNVEKLLRQRVEDEIKDRLFDKLLGGGKEEAAAEGDAAEAAPAEGEPEAEPEEERDIEDEVKDKLKDLFGR